MLGTVDHPPPPCMLVQFYQNYPKKLVYKGDRMENIFLTSFVPSGLSPGLRQIIWAFVGISWKKETVDKVKPLLVIIYPITALWSLTTDFANETSINFTRRHWPSVVLQMAVRGVVQLTSYHPPLVLLPCTSMATHPRCTLSSASMNPQLVYVGCQPLDHSNVLFWNNYHSHTDCDDDIRGNVKAICSAHLAIRTLQITPYITVSSKLAQWRLKLPADRLLTQPFVQVQIKENIKAPHQWLQWGEFTGDR